MNKAMNNKRLAILLPEWVPLENKGEEAIILGMGDVLFPDEEVEFHILDIAATESRFVEGLHIHPGRWFYSRWRSQEFGSGRYHQKLYASGCSILRHALNLFIPGWVKLPHRPIKDLSRRMGSLRATAPATDSQRDRAIRSIVECDYLIAGHDGALNEYECHVIDMMMKFGTRFGVFGSSMKPRTKCRGILQVFARTLQHADFIFCRDEIALEWARLNIPNRNIELAPDPAFGMRPAGVERVRSIIARERLDEFFRLPVVMMATAETPPFARQSFRGQMTRAGKLNAHRELLCGLTRHMVEKHNVNVLFLPQAIGPGANLDDRRVARDVLRRCALPSDRVRLIETEYGARP